jgi:hypothetical protein
MQKQGDQARSIVIVNSKVKPGYRSVTLYHHESTLRLTLEALGLDQSHWPGAAKDATSMAECFSKWQILNGTESRSRGAGIPSATSDSKTTVLGPLGRRPPPILESHTRVTRSSI